MKTNSSNQSPYEIVIEPNRNKKRRSLIVALLRSLQIKGVGGTVFSLLYKFPNL